MPEEIKQEGEVKAPETPKVDAFGQSTEPEPAPEPAKEEAKPIKADVETVATLSTQVGTLSEQLKTSQELHAKKDEDIRNMADKIKRLEASTEQGGDGKAPEKTKEGEVPFPEIKTSADLTEDEKDEMTDDEIKALDEMAEMKKTINAQAKALAESRSGGTGGAVDLNATVQAKARALAGDDIAKANQIIEAFKGAKFNTDDMTAEEIERAVEMSANTVSGYVKPRESSHGVGTGKPAGGGAPSDPHGVEKIVDEVSREVGADTYQL
jgi:hypothetical protein